MNKDLGSFSTKVFAPYLEWSLENDSISGNPFDLDAKAVFTHTKTGEKIETGLFYDGSDYSFRFTAPQTGEWTFKTQSNDADLNGFSGTVNVGSAPNNRGFVVAENGKFAQQMGDGSLEALLPNMAMMSTDIEDYYNKPGRIDDFVETFIDEHGFTGVHIPNVAAQLFDLFSKSSTYGTKIDGSQGVNPDPRAFEVLEDIIAAVHKAGGIVHIWPWGDSARGQTPDQLPGGENGAVHQRIMEYMADRLGPLPGWTLGYGFDNFEWTTPKQAAKAADYFNSQSDYDHLTGIRGGKDVRDGGNHNSEANWHRAGQDFADYEHHEPDYDAYVAAYAASNGLPVQSGDRFRIRDTSGPGKDFTAEQTVDTLWISTMAGGASGIYGNLTKNNGQILNSNEGSLSYSSAVQDQISTWNSFFVKGERFVLDSERANDLTGGKSKKQYALESKADNHVVIYAEDTKSVELNLARLANDRDWGDGAKVIAVNTSAEYREINLGFVELENQTISLPKSGDWALFIEPAKVSGGSTTNTGPRASYDRVAAEQDETITIDVLRNDTDADGDDLSVVSVNSAKSGEVELKSNGKVVYTADDDFTGRDSFTYQISDGNGGTSTARVDIDVSAAPEPKPAPKPKPEPTPEPTPTQNSDPKASYNWVSTTQGETVTIDVLANDKDRDGDELKVMSVTSASAGQVKLTSKGDVVYTADDDYTGRDRFTYTISDGNGGTSTARVDIGIKASNVKPAPEPEPNPSPMPTNGLVYSEDKMSFNGSGKKIDELTLKGDFTVMGTVKLKQGTNVNEFDALVGDGSYGNGNDLNFYDGKFRLYTSDGAPRDVVVADTEAEAGSTAHYAVTRKDGITKLFIDGVLEDKSTQNWTSDFTISELGSGVKSRGLTGTVTDLAIYDRAISRSTIEEIASDDDVSESVARSVASSSSGPTAVYSLDGDTEVSGNRSVVSVKPDSSLKLEEATVSLFFNADDVSGTSGLFSKDANGYVGGDHMRARIENGDLVARFQTSDGQDAYMRFEDVKANETYHLAMSFGDDGVKFYVNGALVDKDASMDMDWQKNVQYLHIGGDGSSKSSGSKDFRSPFDGTITDFEIYDEQLRTSEIAQLSDIA